MVVPTHCSKVVPLTNYCIFERGKCETRGSLNGEHTLLTTKLKKNANKSKFNKKDDFIFEKCIFAELLKRPPS